MITLDDCVRLATFGHTHVHQLDKAGEPYINHPLRVMRYLQDEGAPPYEQMAGVLHDVTEDTPWTPEMLLAFGVTEPAVNIVRAMDRKLSKKWWTTLREEHDEGLHFRSTRHEMALSLTADEFYYWDICQTQGARRVKLADIRDNSLPWRLVYLDQATQDRLAKKYEYGEEQLARW